MRVSPYIGSQGVSTQSRSLRAKVLELVQLDFDRFMQDLYFPGG
jgi:hypothetical protein